MGELECDLYCSLRGCYNDFLWKHEEIEDDGAVILTVLGAFSLNMYLRYCLSQEEVRAELNSLFLAFVAEYEGEDGNG
jgi:hypothetical protein